MILDLLSVPLISQQALDQFRIIISLNLLATESFQFNSRLLIIYKGFKSGQMIFQFLLGSLDVTLCVCVIFIKRPIFRKIVTEMELIQLHIIICTSARISDLPQLSKIKFDMDRVPGTDYQMVNIWLHRDRTRCIRKKCKGKSVIEDH